MIIREAGQRDCAQMDRLLTELIRDEAQYDANLDPGYLVSGNYAAQIGQEGHRAFVAEEDGRTVGFIYGFVCRVPGMHLRPIAVLDALFVGEAYRRRGVAGRLIAAFRSFAEESGAGSVELKVLSDNEKALKLYEKLGFRETKRYLALELRGSAACAD